ncbi:hypothetical protein BKA62DRAFT_484810 [Auriculariales sp. MPI-PUGE-AT-0066]|nr:hypothetical protein BKA62DRAFT_484810 [Auriculariales sp. MPI-PUGE-AT-0066]
MSRRQNLAFDRATVCSSRSPLLLPRAAPCVQMVLCSVLCSELLNTLMLWRVATIPVPGIADATLGRIERGVSEKPRTTPRIGVGTTLHLDRAARGARHSVSDTGGFSRKTCRASNLRCLTRSVQLMQRECGSETFATEPGSADTTAPELDHFFGFKGL